MMSKQHETTLEIPIKFTNFPVEKILSTNSQEQSLEVTVKAPGFSLLLYRIFSSQQIKLDIRSAYWKESSNQKIAFWNTKNEWKEIKKAIYGSMDLATDGKSFLVSPEVIELTFIDRYSKLIAIKVNHDIQFKDQFRLASKEIIFFPDSIMVYGKQSCLDTIRYLSTELLDLKDVHKTKEYSLSLKDVNCADYNKNQKISTEVRVEKFAEKSIEVPITVLNLPKEYSLRLLPSKVNLKVSAPVDKFELISSDLFSARIDYNKILPSEKNLSFELVSSAEFITIHWQDPKSVEYILIRE